MGHERGHGTRLVSMRKTEKPAAAPELTNALGATGLTVKTFSNKTRTPAIPSLPLEDATNSQVFAGPKFRLRLTSETVV